MCAIKKREGGGGGGGVEYKKSYIERFDTIKKRGGGGGGGGRSIFQETNKGKGATQANL